MTRNRASSRKRKTSVKNRGIEGRKITDVSKIASIVIFMRCVCVADEGVIAIAKSCTSEIFASHVKEINLEFARDVEDTYLILIKDKVTYIQELP
ncbi:hypothetical protein MTR_1g054580 [Medicago truncatula]|uniref:Uncharacterized protein n=1 Tax=Medicago truncatula TaxID=3880 RepID=A0A072VUH9_MEDTR|nr:hypothetical protein MTR_1g054580 [Medicago truncatula]